MHHLMTLHNSNKVKESATVCRVHSSSLQFYRFTVAELMCSCSTLITEAPQYCGGVYFPNVLSQTNTVVYSL